MCAASKSPQSHLHVAVAALLTAFKVVVAFYFFLELNRRRMRVNLGQSHDCTQVWRVVGGLRASIVIGDRRFEIGLA